MVAPHPRKKKVRKAIIGVGVDNKDDHTRITRVEDIHLFGGSEDTHNTMEEKAIKFNEELGRRGINLHKASIDECREIANKLDMPLK